MICQLSCISLTLNLVVLRRKARTRTDFSIYCSRCDGTFLSTQKPYYPCCKAHELTSTLCDFHLMKYIHFHNNADSPSQLIGGSKRLHLERQKAISFSHLKVTVTKLQQFLFSLPSKTYSSTNQSPLANHDINIDGPFFFLFWSL